MSVGEETLLQSGSVSLSMGEERNILEAVWEQSGWTGNWKIMEGEKGEEPSSGCTGWKLQRGKQPGDLEFSGSGLKMADYE